jgi:hypothetical protein
MTRTIGAVALVATLLGVTACSSGPVPPTEPTARSSPSSPGSVIGSVSPPRPGGAPSIPPTLSRSSALGHTVFITDTRFVPSILIAGIDAPVVFWNTTNAAQTVRFLNYGAPLASGPIPPGASWTFRPSHAASIVYESGTPPNRRGSLQIELVQSTG